jgi:menaquinone-dependent protoporphyrinogen oxidase
MRVLVAYDTRHGSTRDAAERVAEAVRGGGLDAELLDLRSEGAAAIPLEGYGAVALGAPFYMGRWSSRARAFAARRERELKGKAFGLFVLGADPKQGEETVKAALPVSLRGSVLASAYLGGRLDFHALGRFERFVMKMVSGGSSSYSNLDLAKAEGLGRALAAELRP